jgi:hypothetical protein
VIRRAVALILLSVLLPTSAFAQSIRQSAKDEVAKLVQAQRPSTARGDNPYETPAILLMAGGAGLTVLAAVLPPGLKCDNFGDCATTGHKGLLVSGLGLAGFGAVLFLKGQSQRRPDIVPLPGRGLYVGQRLTF